jgi:hypothetical protein
MIQIEKYREHNASLYLYSVFIGGIRERDYQEVNCDCQYVTTSSFDATIAANQEKQYFSSRYYYIPFINKRKL